MAKQLLSSLQSLKRWREDNLDMYDRISQLFLINALTCGLEVCLAAGTIYIPPMLLEAGVEERFMTMVLGKSLQKRSLSKGILEVSGGWNGLSCAPRFWKGRSVSIREKYAICAYWEECVHSLLYQKYVKYEQSNTDTKFLKGHFPYTRFCHDATRCVAVFPRDVHAIQRSLNADVKTNIATHAWFDSQTDDSNEPVLFMNCSNRRVSSLIWTRQPNPSDESFTDWTKINQICQTETYDAWEQGNCSIPSSSHIDGYIWLTYWATNSTSMHWHFNHIFNVFNAKEMLISLWRAFFLKCKCSCII